MPEFEGNMGESQSQQSGEGLSGRLQERMSDATSRLRESAQEAKGRISETIDQVSGHMGEYSQRLREMAPTDYEQLWSDVKEHARVNPGQALLISAGVGFALGMLVRGSFRMMR